MNREQSLCQHILETAKSGIIEAVNGIELLVEFDNVYDAEQIEQLRIIGGVSCKVYHQLNIIFWDKYSELDTDCEDSRQLTLPFSNLLEKNHG